MFLRFIQDTILGMRLLRNLSYGIRPRIYIILRGGLGNQLHQIAAGVKFVEKANGKVIIYPHIVDNATNPDRRGFFRDIKLNALFPTANIVETNFLEALILRVLNSKNFKGATKLIVHEANFLTHHAYPFTILKGWFQTFEFIPESIDFLALKTSTISHRDEVTLHVRLTDFLSIDKNPLQSIYYQKALAFIQTQIDVNQLRCFSDDIDGAKSLLPEKVPYSFPEILTPCSAPELLAQLANSSSLISSKSSLCWWAANTVTSSGGIVISPWEDATHRPEWIRI